MEHYLYEVADNNNDTNFQELSHEEFYDLFYNETEITSDHNSHTKWSKHELTVQDLVILSLFAVILGIFISVTIYSIDLARNKIWKASNQEPFADDVLKNFSRVVLAILVGMCIADFLDFIFHFDYYFINLLDWKSISIDLSYFIEYLRIIKRTSIVAVGSCQLLGIHSVIYLPWHWAVASIIGTFLYPTIVLSFLVAIGHYTVNRFLEMVVIPMVTGAFLLIATIISAKRKKNRLDLDELTCTKITLTWLITLLFVCLVTMIFELVEFQLFYPNSWVTGDTIIYSVSMMASLALPTSYAMFIHGCNGRFTSSCFGFLNHGSERLRDPSGAFSRRIDHRINAMPFPTNLFANVPSILGRSWDDHGHDEAETFVNFTIDDGDLDPERNQVQQLQHPF